MSKNDITGDDIKTDAASEKYRSGWDKIAWGKRAKDYVDATHKEFAMLMGSTEFSSDSGGAMAGPIVESLSKCAASRDGDCSHKLCPQLNDNEPAATGRSCPLYDWDGHDYD